MSTLQWEEKAMLTLCPLGAGSLDLTDIPLLLGSDLPAAMLSLVWELEKQRMRGSEQHKVS